MKGQARAYNAHRNATPTVMKNVAKAVATFMEELEADGPAVAVAPCLLLEGRDGVGCAGPAQNDAAARNELGQNPVLRVEPKVFVLPKRYACAYMRSLVEGDGDSSGCLEHEVDVEAAEKSRKEKDKAQECSIMIRFGAI